jgi:biotin transport system substrate-specific component
MAPTAADHTLRAALVPRPALATEAVLVLGGAGLVALCAQISIALPFTPVPITLQTMAVLLVGGSLGALRGAASLCTYVLAGIVGLHVFAQGDSGWSVVTGPTGGYLVGMIVAAAVVGALAEARWDREFRSSVSAMLTGSVAIYACGLGWLAHDLHTGLEKTLELGLYPFVVGDLAKLYVAGALLPGAWRLIRGVRGK